MGRLALVLFLSAVAFTARAQTSRLIQLTREVDEAVRNDDLVKAADLTRELNAQIRERYHAWLNRNTGQRVNEILSWLPRDTESLLVIQKPSIIRASDPVLKLAQVPHMLSMFGRLMAVDDRKVFRQLDGSTVTLVVNAALNVKTKGTLVESDEISAYVLSEPVDVRQLGPFAETLNNRPIWRSPRRLDLGISGLSRAGQPADPKEVWYTLAQPDMLVISWKRETMLDFLARVESGGHTDAGRALPDSLPEWTKVNRTRSMWGLRHFQQHDRDSTTGIAVNVDPERNELEIFRRSKQPPRELTIPRPTDSFTVTPDVPGWWRFKSERLHAIALFFEAESILGFSFEPK